MTDEKIAVHKLAKELGMKSTTLIKTLNESGVNVKSHLSMITRSDVEKLNHLKVQETKNAEVKLEQEKEKQDKKVKPSYSVSRETSDWIAKAKEAQERRIEVPLTSVSRKNTIVQKEIINRFAEMEEYPGQDNPEGYHFMFGDRDQVGKLAYTGYQPVLDKGQPLTYGESGDVLVKIPTKIYLDELEAIRQQDERRLKEGVSGKGDVDGEGGMRAEREGDFVKTTEVDIQKVAKPAGVG